MKWKPDRVPDLDRCDLETIVLLVREYGSKHIPVFSKRLMQKVEESLGVYIDEEKSQTRLDKRKTMLKWPEGTEYLSNGPFFEVP